MIIILDKEEEKLSILQSHRMQLNKRATYSTAGACNRLPSGLMTTTLDEVYRLAKRKVPEVVFRSEISVKTTRRSFEVVLGSTQLERSQRLS